MQAHHIPHDSNLYIFVLHLTVPQRSAAAYQLYVVF